MRCKGKDWFVDILLGVDQDSRAYRDAARHVESCPACQELLAKASQRDVLVGEICDTLRNSGELTVNPAHESSSSIIVSVESLMAEDNPIDYEPVSLEFLAPASHPEMLGRIGRYDVERLIGTGGMGMVLKGFDSELHRVVAVKVLLPHLANSGAARRRFAREAQAAAAVVHEHVIPIYNVESDGELPYLVMQYVPGQSLQARVDEQGPLDVKESLRLARQIAAGLAAAHEQGLVHRDVKPANILLEDTVDRVLISDFGLARAVDDAGFTRTGTVAGTPHYMSPEQASGQSIDHRSDLFSLGAVIYFMCAGRPPFRADSAMAVLNRICHEAHRPLDDVNADVPVELVDLVDTLLAKKADDRFATASVVESKLAALLSDLQQGRHSTRLRWLRRLKRRRLLLWRTGLVGAATAVCMLAGALLMYFSGTTNTSTESKPKQVGAFPVQREAPAIKRDSAPSKTDVAVTPGLIPQDTFANDLRELRQLLDNIESQQQSDLRGVISTGRRPGVFDENWRTGMADLQSQVNRLESRGERSTVEDGK